MTKYSNEFKLMAIQKILDGNSINNTAKILKIPKPSLRTWLYHYKKGGIEQLFIKNRKYAAEFKKEVIEYKWEHGLSLIQTTILFKIPNHVLIASWEKKYLAEGFSGLIPKKKGRLTKMPKQKDIKPQTLTREQEAENAQLRMENAYLKKLNALGQARKKQEQAKK